MDATIKSLKNRINSKDWILQGTLLKQYKQCGKNNCRCHQGKQHWHGPDWIWTRKENGKTITKTLRMNQVKMVQRSLENRKKIKQLVEKWKMLSLQHMEKI